MPKAYHHLTRDQRCQIYALNKRGFTQVAIASDLGVSQGTIRRDMIQIERKTEQFFDRIVESDSHTLITAYEKKIRQLEKEKSRLDENIAKCGRPLTPFDETFRTPEKSMPFSFLEELSTPQSRMVRPKRVELLTF